MAKIQENDIHQMNFIKMKLDKFSGFISQVGNEMNKQSEELSQNQKIIDPSVDMQIFIETKNHKNDEIENFGSSMQIFLGKKV